MSAAPREPGVVITLGRIYGKLLDVERIGNETKIHVSDIRSDVTDHGGRLSALERARWPLPSLSILVALGALAATFLKK